MSEPSSPLPAAAQFLTTFLKPEMWHVYRQIRALREFRPVVLCQKRENEEMFPMAPVLVLPKARTHQLRRLWQKQILRRPIMIYRSEARRIVRALQTAEARLLHIYFGHMGVHLLPLMELSPLPTVVSFHGADAHVGLENEAYRAAMRRMLRRAKLVLARSEALAEQVRALGADPARVRLHRTGIPLDDGFFEAKRAPADGSWRCLQACRLIPKKGLRTTLGAFAEFARRYPKATLSIAGEGPLREEMERTAFDLGVRGRVRFTGFLSQADLQAEFASAHFFLHPSETGADGDQEGIPNSMIEAMAAGLPALATRHGGIPEAVEANVSGILVAEGDHEALARGMIELAGDGPRYSQMSSAAAARARAQFSLTAQTLVLEAIYREAIR